MIEKNRLTAVVGTNSKYRLRTYFLQLELIGAIQPEGSANCAYQFEQEEVPFKKHSIVRTVISISVHRGVRVRVFGTHPVCRNDDPRTRIPGGKDRKQGMVIKIR